MTQPTCKTCRWWHQDHHTAQIQTRYDFAPKMPVCKSYVTAPCVIRSPQPGGWQFVAEDDFCGEHTPKDQSNDRA